MIRTIQDLIDQAHTQSKGMTELPRASVTGAPFTANEVGKGAAELERLQKERKAMKAAVKALTRKIAAERKRVRSMTSRNVAFFQGRFGKTDPRMEEVGGTVLEHHGPKLGPRTPSEAPPGTPPAGP
jgi:hypothetical protein